ncbi:unnamed protein product [Macrosiphum euphorbiae]|uniref:Reverse transcriptase domain-containing protein n=1 Tax=Macrosiphum euphorbiae TaxID=13131 RepID=A0AAV0Y6M7_9HEMI|nr:unnamed protein product [Macrosiphum euphorbiae]
MADWISVWPGISIGGILIQLVHISNIFLDYMAELIAFADDVAVVTLSAIPSTPEESLGVAFSFISNWMSDHGFELSVV